MKQTSTLFKTLLNYFSKQDGLDDLLRMSSCGDGYKRENAVRRLGMLGNPIALPELITRANDWVPQVRATAREAIAKLTTPGNINAFVISLPDLYRLKNCGRENHDELINSVESYLVSGTNVHHVVQGIGYEDPLVARACISLSIERKLIDDGHIVKVGLEHSDLIVRVKASHLLSQLDYPAQTAALALAIRDSFMPIRREAFRLFLKRGASSEFLKDHLFDPHSSIRQVAIKHLQERDLNVAEIYAKYLSVSSAPILSRAIWGLGEVRDTSSIGMIKKHLKSPHASVRKQSLTTLFKLLGSEFEPTLVNFLSDASSAVCKEAARLSAKAGVTFSANDLLNIMQSSSSQHTRNICIGLSKRINKWERLLFFFSLLEFREQCNHVEISQIYSGILHWDSDFNRSASQPTSRQIKELRTKYTASVDVLGSHNFPGVLFTLRSFGIAE